MSSSQATAQVRKVKPASSRACPSCNGLKIDRSVPIELCSRCRGIGTVRPCHCTSGTTCGRCRAAGEIEGGVSARRAQLTQKPKPSLDPSLQRMLDLVTDVNNHLVQRNNQMHQAIEEAYQILRSGVDPVIARHNATERLRNLAIDGHDFFERRGANRMEPQP